MPRYKSMLLGTVVGGLILTHAMATNVPVGGGNASTQAVWKNDL